LSRAREPHNTDPSTKGGRSRPESESRARSALSIRPYSARIELRRRRPTPLAARALAAFRVDPALAALVTDTGGILCHAAVIVREYGLPAVVGTESATTNIADGSRVTVDGSTGDVWID
jgi:PEP-utilising enzyme, mobile domain